MELLKPGSRARLFFYLALIAISFLGLYLVTRSLADRLVILLIVAWGTLIIVYLVYRWRAIPPVYDAQLLELRHLIQLQPLVGSAFIPFSPWAMDPNDLFQLVLTIQLERFETIVECGSGVSTVAIGRLMAQLGRGHLFSLEEDKSWYELMMAILTSEKLDEFVTIIYAPLEEYPDIHAHWYSLDCVSNIKPRGGHIDLLLVDGPKSESTYSRYPALPVFSDWLDEKSLIVLDDTRRPNELAVLEQWERQFPLQIEHRPISPRGQAYIRFNPRS